MSMYADGRPTKIDPETGDEYDPEFVSKMEAELESLIRCIAPDHTNTTS